METLKSKIRAREFVFGGWVSFKDPGIAETFALSGFDFVAIDMEHTSINLQDARDIITACHSRNVTCLPRPVSHSNDWAKPLLEIGANGLFFPMVNSEEQVNALAEQFFFTPKGSRSFGVNRAHGYGLMFSEYINSWNETGIFIPQIESKEAIENIESIVAHPAVDGVMIGPYDLSGSFGVPGETQHPKVRTACEKVIQACVKHGKGCCTQLQDTRISAINQAKEDGYTFFILGSDLFILSEWSKQMRGVIQELGLKDA